MAPTPRVSCAGSARLSSNPSCSHCRVNSVFVSIQFMSGQAAEGRMSKNIAVVGGGPGGYAAAFYAADLGMQVTLIDEAVNPGGVCLYVGCIPSKALLHVAAVINEAEHSKSFGVEFGKPHIDLNRLRDFKNSVVTKLTSGL